MRVYNIMTLAWILVVAGYISGCSIIQNLQNMDLGTNAKPDSQMQSKSSCPKKYCPNTRDKLVRLLKNQNVSLSDIDTSKITDMSFLFANFNDENGKNLCDKISTFSKKQQEKCEHSASYRRDFSGIESWDTSKVKNMSYMFYNQPAFNQDIQIWNVSKVTNMDSTFAKAQSFNQPLESWNVANVKNMDSLFAYAESFNQPLDKWNVSNVENMALLFSGAKSFNQPLVSWNVANVRDMSFMFAHAHSFNQNIQSWNIAKVQNMSWMFEYSPLRYNPPKWYAPWKRHKVAKQTESK